MNIIALIACLLTSSSSALAVISVRGISLSNIDITEYSSGLYISSNTPSFDESLFPNMALSIASLGADIPQYTNIGDYTVLGTGPIYRTFSATGAHLSTLFDYSLIGGISTGNEIGIIVQHPTSNSLNSNYPYLLYTDDWYVPLDGANHDFVDIPYTGNYVASYNIIPETSTYYFLAGYFLFGLTVFRRRR